MTTALDSDERLHSEERETDLDIVQSAYGRVETVKATREGVDEL